MTFPKMEFVEAVASGQSEAVARETEWIVLDMLQEYFEQFGGSRDKINI